MAKSRARYLAELLNSSGRVKKEKSQLTGGDNEIDLDSLPTITNAKLQYSSIGVAGHTVSLGGSVSLNTGDISEHTDYKYYTDTRARGAVSVSGDLSYNSTTGVISYTTPTTIASLSNHDTDDLSEGASNLYFTNERVDDRVNALLSAGTGITLTYDDANNTLTIAGSAQYGDSDARSAISVSGSLSYNSTTGIISYTTPTTIASLSNHDTSDLAEGTNLYYTNARADARITAALIDEDSFATNSATRLPSQQSVKAYVDAQVAGVVDSAPAALNTLNELAAALGDDANFSTTTSTALGNRLRVDTASQGLTGTQQANALTNLGITATKTELNYVDGVTSNIQTQLNSKGTSSFSGSYNDLTNKPTIPTNNNQLTNGAGYITGVTNISGYSGQLLREDNRTISPSELTSGRLNFGFTSWGNNNTSPYADFLHMRSYTDSSGGADNLIMFKKDGIGMRIWQQSWGSSTAYSSYADVWTTGNFTSTNVSNWNTAYGWGNHASAGYSTFSGSYNDLTNKPTIPTNNNQLTNGAGYITDGNTNWNNTYGFITASDSSITSKLPLAGGTMTGELNVTRNGGITGSSAPNYSDVNIELQTSSNHVPGISFHRGGYSATTLYEYDGELYTNAWTTRAQTGKLISSGNLLSYILTVDGSGSGLDADLLDGNNSGAFLKSGAGDSVSGWWINAARNGSGTSPHVYLSHSSGHGMHINTYNTSGSVYALELHNNTTPLLQVWNDGDVVIPGKLQVGPDGNDGYFYSDTAGRTAFAGGDFYIQNSVGNYYNYATNQYLGASSGDNIYCRGNTISGNSWSLTGEGVLSLSSGTAQPLKLTTSSGSPWAIELYRSDTANSSKVFNSGSAWYFEHNTIIAGNYNWHAGNDGSGSGLDADLLDGLNSSQFMRSDTQATTSGSIIVAEDWGSGTYNSAFVIQGNYPSWETRGNATQNKGWLHHQDAGGNYTLYSIASYNGTDWTQRFTFNHGDQTFRNGGPSGNVYWHAGNDGSGSGLDADLLDGYHASSLVLKSGDTMTGQLNMHANSYEGSITFGSTAVWRCGIRQHDDADAELRIWARNANGMIFLATGYDGEPASISRPTDGLVVQGNKVGIGNFSSSDPGYKLQVSGTTYSSDTLYAYAFRGHSNVAGTGEASYHPAGIYSTSTNWLYGTMYRNGSDTYYSGGSVRSVSDIVSDQNYGYGVVGLYSASVYQHVWSMGASYRLAANGVSSGGGGSLYGLAWSYNPNYGYSGSNSQSKSGLNHQLLLMMNGTTHTALGTGIWTNGNVTAYSDRRVKTNIEVIPNALSKVEKLSGYTFDRTDVEEDPSTGETNHMRQTGVIAQEVLEVLPEAVMGSEKEGYSVAYGNMVGLLIEAIKEQQQTIKVLTERIEKMENK